MAGAVAAGLGAGALCLPYLRLHSAVPGLFELRVAFLFPVAILLFQAALAWTPLAGGRGAFDLPGSGRPYWRWPALLAGLAVIAGLRVGWLDPLVESVRPGQIPASLPDWLITLPWVVLFQSLVLTAGVYAFAARFSGSVRAALAAVVLVRVLGAWMQWPDLPAAAWLILFPAAAGGALLQGWIYRTAGFTGLIAAGILLECRHLPRLLW